MSLPQCSSWHRLQLNGRWFSGGWRTLLLLAVGFGCTTAAPTDPGPSQETVSRVTVSPSTINLQVGGTQTLSAAAFSEAGTLLQGRSVTWSSSAPSVATVHTSTGVVTAVGPGSATVQALVEGKAGTAVVSVVAPVHQLTVTMTVGASIRVVLGSTITYCNGIPGGAGVTCTFPVPQGTVVKLSPVEVPSARSLTGWGVAGCGTLPSCEFTMTQPTVVTVGFTLATAASFNLQIQTAYLSQPVQRLDGGVELVAGRSAFLRVFAVANQFRDIYTGAQPKVRIRLFQGAVEVGNWLLTKPNDWVGGWPAETGEPNLEFSYNLLVPANLMVPDLRLLAEVDPEGLIVEQNEADNRYPLSGVPVALPVRVLPQFQIRLVPVLQSSTGLKGDVTAANMEDYLYDLRKLLPIASYAVDLRAPYTTSAPPLQGDNANGAWGTLLSEMLALRNTTDQSSRYYFGVVRLNYPSGTSGLGLIPSTPSSNARVALGFDDPANRSGNLAHELGHNFGRMHAPCGNAPGPDPAFPYSGGSIGAWGLDLEGLPPARKAPWDNFDLMGYCPASRWVSDYTWSAVLNWRLASPIAAPVVAASSGASGPDDGLLVWGRVTPRGVVLEPAFRIAPTGAALPTAGAWRVEGRDGSGTLLFSQPFDPEEVADLPTGPERLFAMVLPVGAARAAQLTSLRVVGPGGMAEQHATTGPALAPPDLDVRQEAGARTRLTWGAGAYPMALIRDAITGEILAFARDGSTDLGTRAAPLEVQLSDGVRVLRHRLAIP